MKTILIGQAPSRTSDPRSPLSGNLLAFRLTNLCNLTKKDYLRRFERKNLLDYWPGKNGKGDNFPVHRAQLAAGLLIPKIIDRKVIFMGRAVAQAFGIKIGFLKWADFNGGKAAILPHPSGVNRWYNNKVNGAKARRFMRRACAR